MGHYAKTSLRNYTLHIILESINNTNEIQVKFALKKECDVGKNYSSDIKVVTIKDPVINFIEAAAEEREDEDTSMDQDVSENYGDLENQAKFALINECSVGKHSSDIQEVTIKDPVMNLIEAAAEEQEEEDTSMDQGVSENYGDLENENGLENQGVLENHGVIENPYDFENQDVELEDQNLLENEKEEQRLNLLESYKGVEITGSNLMVLINNNKFPGEIKFPEFIRKHEILSAHHNGPQTICFTKQFQNRSIFICFICGKILVNKIVFFKHYKTHNKKRDCFRCNKCSQKYFSALTLQRHMKIKHENSKMSVSITSSLTGGKEDNVCNVCGKSLKTKVSLKKHIMSMHLGLRNYFCHFCKKGFYYESDYKIHIKREEKKELQRKFNEKLLDCIVKYEKCTLIS